MSNGIRKYYRYQSAKLNDNLEVMANLNSNITDFYSNISLHKTIGEINIDAGLIFNNTKLSEISEFGRGIRCSKMKSVSAVNGQCRIENADFSVDTIPFNEYNVKLGVKPIDIYDGEDFDHYKLLDLVGNEEKYADDTLSYPYMSINLPNQGLFTARNQYGISNIYTNEVQGEQLLFTYDNGLVTGIEIYSRTILPKDSNANPSRYMVGKVELTYSTVSGYDKMLTNILYKVRNLSGNLESVASTTLVYVFDQSALISYEAIDDVTTQSIKVIFTSGVATKIMEGYNGSYVRRPYVELTYATNKTTISNKYIDESSVVTTYDNTYVIFDNNNLAVTEISEKGLVTSKTYDDNFNVTYESKASSYLENEVADLSIIDKTFDLTEYNAWTKTNMSAGSISGVNICDLLTNKNVLLVGGSSNGSMYRNFSKTGCKNIYTLSFWVKHVTTDSTSTFKVKFSNATEYDQKKFLVENISTSQYTYKSFTFSSDIDFTNIQLIIQSSYSFFLYGLCLSETINGRFYEYQDDGSLKESLSNGGKTSSTYNSDNLIQSTLKPDSSAYFYTYDSSKRLSASSSYGLQASFEYNDNDQITKQIISRAFKNLGYSYSKKEYDVNSIISTETNEMGSITTYEYAVPLKLTKSVTDSNNIRQEYTYDTKLRTSKVELYDDTAPIPNPQLPLKTLEYTYDSMDRTTNVLINGGEMEYIYEYDTNGFLAAVKSKKNNVETTLYTYQYKNNPIDGRMYKQFLGDSSSLEYVETQYDSSNIDLVSTTSISTVTNNGTVVTSYTYEYDTYGRILSILDLNSNIIHNYSYDNDGNVIEYADGSSNTYQYHYDNLKGLSRKISNIRNRSIYQEYAPLYRGKATNPQTLSKSLSISNNENEYILSNFMDKADGTNDAYRDLSLSGTYNGNEISVAPISDPYNQAVFIGVEDNKFGFVHYPVLSTQIGLKYEFTNDVYDRKITTMLIFKPHVISQVNDNCASLFAIKDYSDESIYVRCYIYDGYIKLSAQDLYGVDTPFFTSAETISMDAWNVIGFGFEKGYSDPNDGGVGDYMNYNIFINGKTCTGTITDRKDFVNNTFYMQYAKNITPDNNMGFSYGITNAGLIFALNKMFISTDYIEYWRYIKEYLIDSSFYDGANYVTDTSGTTIYDSSIISNSNYMYIPLSNDIKSLSSDPKSPCIFKERTKMNFDRDTIFKFDNSLKRYVYIATDGVIAYNHLALAESGTVAMQAKIEEKDPNAMRQYFMYAKDSSNLGWSLYYQNGNLYLVILGTTFNLGGFILLGYWYNIGITWNKTIVSDSTSSWNNYEFRVRVGSLEFVRFVDSVSSFGALTIYLGVTDAYAGLRGVISNVVMSTIYSSSATLQSLPYTTALTYNKYFDAFGNLVRKTYPDICEIDHTFEMEKIIDPEDNTILQNLMTENISTETIYSAEDDREDVFEYSYDSVGRPYSINKNNSAFKSFTYNESNELIAETAPSFACSYSFDDRGNILNITGTRALAFEYADANIPDKVTKIGNDTVTYADGYPLNMTAVGNKSFTWDGRKLVGYEDSIYSITYVYNDEGYRSEKAVTNKSTNITTTTYFYYENGNLVCEETNGNKKYYLYDENGELCGTIINDNYYYYIKNIFGDILGLVDENGGYVADYTYDAWGNILSATASIDNGIRYKGYYYDSETDMYYCHTRYYVPKWLRWLNSDNVEYLDTDDFAGINLFVYCGNNPVMFSDSDGTSPLKWYHWLAIGVGAALVLTGAGILIAGAAGAISTATLAGSIALGAAKGALIGAAIGTGVGAIGGGIYSGVTGADFWTSVGQGAALGFGIGAAIGAVAGGVHGGLAYMRSTVVVNGQRVSVYRGGSNMTLKTNEYKILADGTQRGLSVNINPSQVQNFGGAFRVSNVPRGLQIVQQGKNLSHFEIIAKTALTPDKFQFLLNKIILIAL